MKRGVRFLCLLTSLMLFAASAMADDLSEARRLLEEGKYQQALDAVDQNGDTMEGYRYKMYIKAVELGENNQFDLAINSFQQLNGYIDSEFMIQYYHARKLEYSQNYEEAAQLFAQIGAFRDSAAHYASCMDQMLDRDYAAALSQLDASAQITESQALKLFADLADKRYSNDANKMLDQIFATATAAYAEGNRSFSFSLLSLLASHGYANAEASRIEWIYQYALELMSGQNHADYRQAEGYLREAISAGYADASEKLLECQYQMALLADQESDFASAYEGFKALGDYGDSQERVAAYDAAYAAAGQLYQNGQYAEAVAAFEALGNLLDSANNGKIAWYAQAEALLAQGKYDAASEAFARAGDYKDASSRILEPYYVQAEALLAQGEYDAASEAFARAGNYKDALSRILEPYYVQAETLLAQGEYDAASGAFARAGDYKDASSRILEPYYVQAEALLAQGEYDAASEAFARAGNYKDALSRILEPYYVQAETLLAQGEYDAASRRFSVQLIMSRPPCLSSLRAITRRRKNCKTTVNILKQHRCLSKPELMKTQPRGRINACMRMLTLC